MTITLRIAAASALSVMAASASAADLPARVAPAPYVVPVALFTWTGPYFGINAGAAFDNKQSFRVNGAAVNGIGNQSFKDSGFSAGGQIGYNYQFLGSGIVVGLEADAMYMDTDKSVNVTTNGGNTTYRSGLDFLGTVRGRVGYAFNQFLVYGTGGFAYGNVNSRIDSRFNGTTAFERGSGFNTGYAYGGGVEYALPTTSFLNFFHSSAVTLKAEYLRYELDSSNLSTDGTLNTPRGVKVKNDGNLARIGLNYKF